MKQLRIVLLVFGLIFASISLVNHYCFRTEALDLGMFNHSIYSFSRFEWNYFSLTFTGEVVNYFADHFSPITLLLSPLRYIFGTYTLLIVQIAAILFGGLGVYRIAIHAGISKCFSNIITIQFFSLWAIYSALAFDFHTNVLAAMFVPWFVYYYRIENRGLVLIFFLLILITKENMALWLSFIILGLMVVSGKGFKKYLHFEIPLTLFALVYTIVVIGWIMPELNETGKNLQMKWYEHLGEDLPDKIQTILLNPIDTFTMFFNQAQFPNTPVGIKLEFHLVMLLSGGILFLFNPRYLIMLAPIYAQKFFSSSMAQWSINDQYSIEFVPIISLVVIDFARRVSYSKFRKITLIVVSIATISVSIAKMESKATPWFNSSKIAFYQPKHYESGLDRDEVLKALSLVPPEATISVSSCLAPHLAFRDRIYLFPNINDSEYVVLIHQGRDYYPINHEKLCALVDTLIENGKFELIYYKSNMLTLRKSGIVRNRKDVLPPPRLSWNGKINKYRQSIKADPVWLETVRRKSLIMNISLDSMIQCDAIFLIEQELKLKQFERRLFLDTE